MKDTPLYRIRDFSRSPKGDSAFYTNNLKEHIKGHVFTNLPHKHDFYVVMLVTKGSGWHEIDFTKYPVKTGSAFFMQPGQMHYWKLEKETDGYVFFHSRSFFDEGYTHKSVNDFPYFRSFHSLPALQLNKEQTGNIAGLMRDLLAESKAEGPYKDQRLHAYLDLIYTGLARLYKNDKKIKNNRYLEHFHRFEELLEKNYKGHKLPGYYADKLSMTEKHLNRVVQTCISKTSTLFIAERVLLEAKRLLMHSEYNVAEISDELGFSDSSYFIRFFRTHTGFTPRHFLKRYKG